MKQGDLVAFGSWPSTVAQSLRPLEWTVARCFPDGSMLLVAKQIVECREYHRMQEPVSWSDSDLRAWLNDAFLQAAFTESERAAILLQERSCCDVDASSRDAVFCLEPDEAQQLFGAGLSPRAFCTSYARDRGGIPWWWLAGESNDEALNADVSFGGEVRLSATLVDYERMGVRPAVVVDPARVPGWADAEKASAASCAGAASVWNELVAPREYTCAADAAYAADARALRAFFEAGDGLTERAHVKRALQGGYATLCCLERVGFMDMKSAEELLAFVRKQERLACAIARNANLDDFPRKLDLLLALVKGGFLEELSLLEGCEGYYTADNFSHAIDAAHDAGQLEIVAYLLERRHHDEESSTGFYDEDGSFNLSLGAFSLEL